MTELRPWLEAIWYGKRPAPAGLRLLARGYGLAVRWRRRKLSRLAQGSWRSPVPVVVVGNVSLGGTGKTPLVLALCHWLRARGWRPGILSRGYGGRAGAYPLDVNAETPVAACGDEPLLLAERSGCPLVVDPDRPRGARYLLERHEPDILLSDDGLQHYRLQRDLEIAVVDGERGLGNGYLLPAGPLREPLERLQEVDLVVVNGGTWSYPGGHRMRLEAETPRRIDGLRQAPAKGAVHALAAIGHPQRFFAALTQLGYEVRPHAFADHAALKESDLVFGDDLPLIMTEKDAVKCRAFAADNRYYLPVKAQLPKAFYDAFEARLKARQDDPGSE